MRGHLTREQIEAGHCDELAEVVALCDTALAHIEVNGACIDALTTDKHTEPLDLPNRIRDLTEERDRLREALAGRDSDE
jgi:hypothetical protein